MPTRVCTRKLEITFISYKLNLIKELYILLSGNADTVCPLEGEVFEEDDLVLHAYCC